MENQSILFYEGPYYWLSNFSSFQVEIWGRKWMTAEHAYQAAKFLDAGIREAIANASSAHAAKQIARANKAHVRSNWEAIKISVMERILQAKLEQHEYIQRKLLETGERELIENSPVDGFWGRGPNWRGENHLGRLWMKLRVEWRRRIQARA